MTVHATLHATLAAAWRGGVWRGLLIRGPSGAGKSSLALRLMHQGWRLVADDRVIVWRSQDRRAQQDCASQDRLFGRAPAPLAGLIEVRGAGVLKASAHPVAEILHVLDAVEGAPPERTPDPSFAVIEGVSLPRLALDLHDPAAAAAAALWCGAGGV